MNPTYNVDDAGNITISSTTQVNVEHLIAELASQETVLTNVQAHIAALNAALARVSQSPNVSQDVVAKISKATLTTRT